MRRKNGVFVWSAGIAMLLLAGVLAALTPSNAATEVPFRTELVVDEQVETRTIAATLTDVRLADEVTAGQCSVPGIWATLV